MLECLQRNQAAAYAHDALKRTGTLTFHNHLSNENNLTERPAGCAKHSRD